MRVARRMRQTAAPTRQHAAAQGRRQSILDAIPVRSRSGASPGVPRVLVACLTALLTLSAAVAGGKTTTGPSGVFRCWSFNVGGAGKRCTSPPLELRADGTYRVSSEQGTWRVSGDRIVLSASKIRGPGRLVDGNKIVFEYSHNGLKHTVTYLRRE